MPRKDRIGSHIDYKMGDTIYTGKVINRKTNGDVIILCLDGPNAGNTKKIKPEDIVSSSAVKEGVQGLIESDKNSKEIVDEISYAPFSPDRMANLRANNPRQLKRKRDKNRAEQKEWERRYKEYSNLVKRMDRLVSEIEPLQRELDDLYSDMEREAGIKGDDWGDADADRYADEMNPLYDRIQRKKEELSRIKRTINTEFSDLI